MRGALPYWLLVLSLQLGCSDIISLGYRCPEGLRRCEGDGPSTDPRRDGGTDMDSGPDDGGGEDGGGEDGSPDAEADGAPEDGGPDGEGPDAFVALLANRSFELPAGGTPGSIDEATGQGQIDPWVRCPNPVFDISALAVLDRPGGLLSHLEPTEGDWVVQFSYVVLTDFPPLTQKLARPWKAGETRALTFDLAGQGVLLNDLRLRVLGSSTECPETAMRELLAVTPVIPQSAAWTEDVCVEITPEEDLEWLILQPQATVLDATGSGVTGQVVVDNLRESLACP